MTDIPRNYDPKPAENTLSSNYINMMVVKNEVIIQLVVDHKPLGWIAYNKPDLENLIRNLQHHLKELT